MIGFGSPWLRAAIIRASEGVISGRRATCRPPLSSKVYSWPTISAPDLRV